MSDSAALTFETLSFSYGQTPILKDIDLSIGNGEFVSILGVNGAGQSTLLRCACGLIFPASGLIKIGGTDIGMIGRRELSRLIGFVPQRLDIFTDPTVRELVFLGRTPHLRRFDFAATADKRIADSVIEKTSLTALADRPISRISGGELQRALIAMSLAGEQKILLLDEPTTHLDIKHRIGITRMLRELTRDLGIVVIAAIHDIDIVSSFYDRVVVLKDGKVRADGEPRSVINPRLIKDVFDVDYPDDWPLANGERPISP